MANYNTNVAPPDSPKSIHAIDHLQARFDETYRHLKKASG